MWTDAKRLEIDRFVCRQFGWCSATFKPHTTGSAAKCIGTILHFGETFCRKMTTTKATEDAGYNLVQVRHVHKRESPASICSDKKLLTYFNFNNSHENGENVKCIVYNARTFSLFFFFRKIRWFRTS